MTEEEAKRRADDFMNECFGPVGARSALMVAANDRIRDTVAWAILTTEPPRGGRQMTSELGTPWALYRDDKLVYIGLHKDEADAWQIALGWPEPAEIAQCKADGDRMVAVTIAEVR